MVGDSEGLSVRFYLGVSPDTANFANKASFAFIIYNIEPAWGFRSAIEKYYSFYPDYYTARLKRDGLWLLNMRKNVVFPNVDQYGWNRGTEAERDEKYGILTFPYVITGVREIKRLPDLSSQ